MRDDETPIFNLGAEVSKATADYLAERAIPKLDFDSFGYALAMRVMQSDLYAQLDDRERAECDALISNVLHRRRAIPGVDFVIPESIRKPSFPAFVQDLAAQLFVIIDDTDAEMVKERERLATALYDEATRMLK